MNLNKTVLTYLDNTYRDGSCYIWKGGFINKNSRWAYPATSYGNSVCRIILAQIYGSIPSGMNACHKCDNTKCINPDHLYIGSSADNSRDIVERGRIGTSKLTKEEVKDILLSHYNKRETGASLGRRYNIASSSIYLILKGKHYPKIFLEVTSELKDSPRLARVLSNLHTEIRATAAI